MATTLYQPRGGHIDHKYYDSFYSRTFDNIVIRNDEVPREGAQFFSERTTNLADYKEGEVSSVLETPRKNEDTARIPLLTPVEGYNKTWTNSQYRSGFMVTRRAVKSQKTRMIAKMLTGLPKSAQRLEELAYASMFNGAFATETGGDGSYLCAADHNHEDISYGTWSNTGTAAAFSTTSYFAAWLSFQTRKNEKGYPDPMVPETVLYVPAIHEAVMKVRGSDKYPQNSLNATLPELFGQFKPVIGHWMTSTTNWFVHAKVDEADRGFVIVWQDKPTYEKLSDGMNPEVIMGRRLLMSFSVAGLHGRDWYGNSGA